MIQKKTSFSIYNASAGSGKTYTLVKEYLKIILLSSKEDAYRNILAITFTNKAVQEMKSRIVDSLFDFTRENPSDKSLDLMKDLSVETGLSLNDISKKSKSIIKNIIHNYAAFDISTIDKFTHKVIRAFAIDLNLPITFEVTTDTENLLQEAVDSIVDEAGNNPELTKLLIDFTMEKTDDDKSWDVSNEILNTGKLILNENNREEVISLKGKSIEDFITLKKRLNELVKVLEDETKEMAKQVLVFLDQKNINLASFSGKHFPNHLQGISEGKFNFQNKTYNAIDDFKVNKSAKDKAIIENCLPQLIDFMFEIYEKFKKKNLYEAFLKNITPLSLLNTVSGKLKNIQEEQNILSISEFNKLINEQIQNQPAPFIYERLGEKYKHFFIDEFQDTSEMQWQNLIPLIDNALSSEDEQGNRGSLLIVGDPKQSIYRWRGGKAEQFIELSKKSNPFSNKDQKVVNLETNYRSYDQVINFNNDFFGFLAQKFNNEDYRDLYLNNSFQKSNSKKGGYVSISFLPESVEEEIEEEEIAPTDLYLIKTLQTILNVQQNGFSLNEIVILVRNNKNGVLLANYLTENGIPVISSESLLLSTATEVQFLVNMLRYLIDKKNKEALALCLYYFVTHFETKLEVHDFIWNGLQFENEYDLESWIKGFGIDLQFSTIRKKPLYEMVEELILKAIPPQKNNAYVQYFLDSVLEKDIKYQFSISEFLDFWDKNGVKLSVPTSESAEAIKIMTIHKSKGLEFPVVIFPFAEENYSSNKRETMWLDATEDETSIKKILINKSNKVKDFGDNAAQVYEEKKQEDLLDNINVLYVALTRAEEQLHVISSWKKRNKSGELPNNLASYFIEYVEDKVGFEVGTLFYSSGNSNRISIKAKKSNEVEIIPPVLSSLQPENIKIAQREALMWGSKQEEAIEFGNTVHEILSYIKYKNDLDIAITKALENGLITQSQKESIQQIIQQIIHNPDLNDFFRDDAKVLNEQVILKKNSKNHIPDRMVFLGMDVYLLDYKTGDHLQNHIIQISDYQNVLTQMGYIVKRKVLVYIGEQIKVVSV